LLVYRFYMSGKLFYLKKVLVFLFVLSCAACNVVTLQAQVIGTLAGDGIAGYTGDGGVVMRSEFDLPVGLAIDKVGNVYIADQVNNRVRKITLTGVISTVAGSGEKGYAGDNGPATAAQLSLPAGVAIDNIGNLYIADGGNYRIRKVDANGIIVTIAGKSTGRYNGDNWPATDAAIGFATGVALDGPGNIYITDVEHQRIRKISPDGIITRYAGSMHAGYSGDSGTAVKAELNIPWGITANKEGEVIIADEANNRIRKISASGVITTIAGTGAPGYTGDGGMAIHATLDSPTQVIFDTAGNLFIADGANNCIRKVDANGIITTFAGTGKSGYTGDGGPATEAMLSDPAGMAWFGNTLYFSDRKNNRVRYIKPAETGSTEGTTTYNQSLPDKMFISATPSEGKFRIFIKTPLQDPVQFVVTNIAGKTIKEFSSATNTNVSLVINDVPGVYIITATSPHQKWTRKVVVGE